MNINKKYEGGHGSPMSALRPLLLSLGRFLPSHWAGFSQGKTGLVALLAALIPALGPLPRP